MSTPAHLPANFFSERNQNQSDSDVSDVAQDPPSPQGDTIQIQVAHPTTPKRPPSDGNSEMFVVLVGFLFVIVVLMTALISTASKNELRRKP